MIDDGRPNPQDLLDRISQDEEKERRGKLKIFFGFSAGVGKTYAMLKAALSRSQEGLDVLVGLVETHGRVETENLLNGLKILPPLEISYKSIVLKEFDLDAALTRKPDLLLVDELAHTNAPGTRHPKRWNDVLEILDAGIDVYTTLNVQHIESLNDVVAATTGIWVQETVPDTLFDMAEDVVLVDLDEDDLIQRLHEGKVYLAPGAQARAADHFFKRSNLQALREIALRRTADRVDAQRETSDEKKHTRGLAEKILVCLDTDALAAQIIRTSRRLAMALRAPWEAVHVQTSATPRSDKIRFLSALERMVERLGGTMVLLRGPAVIDEIIAYAHEKRFTKIVVGKNTQKGWRSLLTDLFISRLIARSKTIDVYVVLGETTRTFVQDRETSFWKKVKFPDYLKSAVIGAILIAPVLSPLDVLPLLDHALLCLIGTAVVAERMGLGPALFYAFLTIGALQGRAAMTHELLLPHQSPVLSFFVMFAANVLVATQAARLHAQVLASRLAARRSQETLALTRQLTSVNGRIPVADLVARHIVENMGGKVTIWMTDSQGHPASLFGELPEETYHKEFGALEWCFENGLPAGVGTTTLPSAAGLYLPLETTAGTIGVLGYYPDGAKNLQESQAFLESTIGILATTLDRVRAEEIARAAILQKDPNLETPQDVGL